MAWINWNPDIERVHDEPNIIEESADYYRRSRLVEEGYLVKRCGIYMKTDKERVYPPSRHVPVKDQLQKIDNKEDFNKFLDKNKKPFLAARTILLELQEKANELGVDLYYEYSLNKKPAKCKCPCRRDKINT